MYKGILFLISLIPGHLSCQRIPILLCRLLWIFVWVS